MKGDQAKDVTRCIQYRYFCYWLGCQQSERQILSNSNQRKGKLLWKLDASGSPTPPKNLTFYTIRRNFQVRNLMSSWLLFCNFKQLDVCTTPQFGLIFNFIDSSKNKVRILFEIKYLPMKLQLQNGFWFIVSYYSIACSSLACLVFHLLRQNYGYPVKAV